MRKISLFLLFLLTISSVQICAQAEEAIKDEVTVEETILCPGAKAAVLYESKTDTLLYNQEMNLRLSPASMTKIMTLLLIYEALEKNVITKETIVTISETAKSMEGSKAFLSVGEQITVDELIKCICIASANDAAVAMAETICGTEEAFVEKMNAKVETLGLKNTHFSDCTGLSSKNHYTSCYDLAIISNELLDRFPEVLDYTSIKEDYIRKDSSSPFWLVNTNKLLGRVDGINGLKTGYTSFSGYCITLHMDKNNLSLISVVMGYTDSKVRNGESVKLLNYGANNYELKTLYAKDEVIKTIDSILYKKEISIVVKKDVYFLCKKGTELAITSELEYHFTPEFGGTLTIYNNGESIQTETLETLYPLEKRGIIELLGAVLYSVFN